MVKRTEYLLAVPQLQWWTLNLLELKCKQRGRFNLTQLWRTLSADAKAFYPTPRNAMLSLLRPPSKKQHTAALLPRLAHCRPLTEQQHWLDEAFDWLRVAKLNWWSHNIFFFFFCSPKKKKKTFSRTQIYVFPAADAQQVARRCSTIHNATTPKLHLSQKCLILCHRSSKAKAWCLACTGELWAKSAQTLETTSSISTSCTSQQRYKTGGKLISITD